MSAPQSVKVLMRNFPKSWVAPQDRPGLPTRIQKILCRFGVLLGEPEVFGGVGGDVTAIACFETLNSAEAAVKTLLGADMRTAAEKQAAGNRAPSESERFWVEIQAGAVPSKARPSQIPVVPEAIPEESFVLVRGFPSSWTEPQVKYLFVVFGGTSSIRMVPDAEFVRAARVILKDASAMQRAAASLNETDVGDGDMIQECHIYCEYVAGRLERERLEQAAAAAAAAEKQRRRAEKEERRRQKEERRRKHAEEKERQMKEAEEERLRQEALEERRRQEEEERLERLRLEAVEEERLRKQVEEEEQLRREADEAEEEERIRLEEEEEERLRREAEEEEERLQREAEELQRLRRGEEEFQRKRLLAEEQARAMQELEEQRERELEEQREREREEEEEQKRQEALEEERLREIEAQAEQERIRLEEERVEAAKAEAEAERLQKEEAASVRQRSARRSLDRRDRAHGHHRRDAEKSTSAVRRKRRRSRSSRTRRKERRRRRREASRSRSRSQTEHRKRRARRGRRPSSEKSPKERSEAVEEQDVREPSPDVMVNGQAQPLEPPQESQVAPDVQASEADPIASMDQWQGHWPHSGIYPGLEQSWSPAQAPDVFARHPDVPGLWQPDPGHAASSMESTAAPVAPPAPAPPPASAPAPSAPAPEAAPIQEVPVTSPAAAAPELAKPEAKASAKSRGTFSMAWGAVPSRAAATVPTPVNLYQQQFQQWQQQQQQVQEHYHLEQERQKRLEEELKVELQQQLQRQIEEKAREEEEEKRQQELSEEERRRQEEKEMEERRKREAKEQERREAEAAAAAARQKEEERSRHMHTRQQAGWPEWPPQLPHLQQFRPDQAHALFQTGGQMGQARQTHQVHPAHHFAPAEVHQMGHAYPHGHPQAGHLPQAYAPGTASQQTIHLTGQPMQTSAQDVHQRQTGDFLSSTAGSGRPCGQVNQQPDEPEDDAPTEPSASPQAPDNDDADTEAPTEESDYDPFAGQGKEYNPFAEAESAVMEDDGEDEGAFDSLIEMLRAAERGCHSAPSRATEQSQPQRREARPLDTGEQFEKAKPKPKTHYHFNHATQRWEPKVLPPSPPRTEPSRGDRFRETPSWRNAPPSPPRQAPIKLVVAECEAEARADAANSFCSFAQALAVRLALRFESRPKDILVSMSEAGLPAAKDQRSTVKAIMRLCHPDKCKHPDAKRAMQILGPLLS